VAYTDKFEVIGNVKLMVSKQLVVSFTILKANGTVDSNVY
jgi:hypothetical protein